MKKYKNQEVHDVRIVSVIDNINIGVKLPERLIGNTSAFGGDFYLRVKAVENH